LLQILNYTVQHIAIHPAGEIQSQMEDSMSERATTGQVNTSAAEVYDLFFVPALFGAWAEPLCDAAGLKLGVTVLDVACGTGATTRVADRRVGTSGSVTGLDRNAGMLSVARTRAPEIRWLDGRAESLPFPAEEFDAVLCQFGLMFFDDRVAALTEMQRVLRPGGCLAVSVWDNVQNSPGYAGMIKLIDRLFGSEPAAALQTPFVLGEKSVLRDLATAAGLEQARITTRAGVARFASIQEWVRMDVRGWTLSDMIDDDQFKTLVSAAERELNEFVSPDGSVSFDAPAHFVTYTRPN
jgi:ubiquinone/menaquinone biosynthesis C-methylase UbiE